MYQIIAYIKFLLSSTNQHGVHSPFVYDLVTKCFYNKKKIPAYIDILNYRKELLNSKRSINVTDFGAGSRVFKSNTRKISAIAKNAGISSKRAKLLYRITNYFQSKEVLELGTSLGIATMAIAKNNPNSNVTTIEGCPETAKIAKELFYKYEIKNVNSITSDFSIFLNSIKNEKDYDLVYFDGNHTKKATISYFNKLLTCANDNSIFIFDDIHWSKEMEEAWDMIKTNPSVSISIDTFFWGLIFFRKENKHQEHFKIRL